MKISYNWLKEYIDIDLPPVEIAEILTNIGLEVEGVEKFESVKGGLEGLFVGEVLTKQKHPNADKLTLTTVKIGNGNDLQIVCGAPNVATGQKVIVAPVGTTLYPSNGDSFKIKKVKIRGESSEGMICAEDEIGLGNDHEGIIVLDENAKIGDLAKKYFDTESDTIFEIGLTPNRPDAASHIGVSRDLAAFLGKKVKHPDISSFSIDNNDTTIDVKIEAPEACPRYVGLTIDQVEVKESPSWLLNKLKSIGLSPINNIVDITNYVLHEQGQPLHAFDADHILDLPSGKKGKNVIIKKVKESTPFTTLDEVERKLSDEDLMICNEEECMCIAGVFGGIKSGVTEKTTKIFLESAYFDPIHIRKTAKRHGLYTDASFRFERGADPNNTVNAMKRAAILIKEIAGGRIVSEVIDQYPKPIKNYQIELSFVSVNNLIGKKIPYDRIKEILTNLDIEIINEDKDGLKLSVPPYKVDVQREADVIEEILRIYGYNNIETPSKLSTSLSFIEKPDKHKVRNQISNYLASIGFNEIINNPITSSSHYDTLDKNNADKLVHIINPLSKDLDTLRLNLLFEGMETIAYNLNRKNNELKFFEFGKAYSKMDKDYSESENLSILMTGRKQTERWNADKGKVTIYYLKTCLNNILTKLGITSYEEKQESHNFVNDGLIYHADENMLAFCGTVKKDITNHFDIDQEVLYAELKWDEILNQLQSNKIQFKSIPKYPSVRRDIALLIDQDIKFEEIKKIALKNEKNLINKIDIFDVYEGKQVPEGKKSYAISFVFLDEKKTLTDHQVDKIIQKIIDSFKAELSAVIR